MAKRLADTEIWKKNWYRKLSPIRKCLFKYLCDNCDHAGMLDIDFELMSFQIGGDINKGDLDCLGDMIKWVSDDKIFMLPFIQFQYNVSSIEELNPKNKVHKSAISILEKYKLSPLIAPCIAPLEAPYIGSKDKDKDKDKETLTFKSDKSNHETDPKRFPRDLKMVLDYAYLEKKLYKFDAWHFYDAFQDSNWCNQKTGEPIKNWKSNLRTWAKNGFNKLGPSHQEVFSSYMKELKGQLEPKNLAEVRIGIIKGIKEEMNR